MARMPLLASTTTGERRRLFELWATAPSAFNWQEPLGQDNIPPWSSWPSDTQKQFLFAAPFVALIVIGLVVCLVRRCNKTNKQDTSMFVPRTWSNDNNEDVNVIAPLPPWQQQQEQSPPASGDDHASSSNIGRGDGPLPPRRRRRQQPTDVAEVPAADLDLAWGDVQLTEAGVEWVMANLAPTTDMEMAPMEDAEEIAPAPEPAPTVKCTFSKAEGWAEGVCSVCLSELVDGVKVRVLTACMHCFHATCVERWLRENATCPLCRAPTMVVPARGRRRRRPVDSNLSLA